MQQPTPAGQGQKLAILSIISDLTKLIADCSTVELCEIQKLTILVEGYNGREQVLKSFIYPPGTVPGEIKEFFIEYRKRLVQSLTELRAGVKLLRVGSQIVILDDFLKDYSAGVLPAIDPDTIQKIGAMNEGDRLTVLINHEPHELQRIN